MDEQKEPEKKPVISAPELPNIEEITEVLKNIQFFSDQVRFNSVLYQGFSLMLEKLNKIEELLSKNGQK